MSDGGDAAWLGGCKIHNACLQNKPDLVQRLLHDNNSGKDCLNERNSFGYTALHAAAWNGDTVILDTLLSAGAQVNRNDNLLNLTPLWCASRRGNMAAMGILIHVYHAKVDMAPNVIKDTPLHNGVRLMSYGCVQLLLHANSDVELQDPEGNAPLHICCQNLAQNSQCGDSWEICKLLLKHGASPQSKNNRGKSPLEVIYDKHIRRRVENLASMVVNETKVLVNTSEDNGHSSKLAERICNLETELEHMSTMFDINEMLSGDLSKKAVQRLIIQDEKIADMVISQGRHADSYYSMLHKINNIEEKQIRFQDELEHMRQTIAELKQETQDTKQNCGPPKVTLDSCKWAPVFDAIAKQIGMKWDNLYRALVMGHIADLRQIEANIHHIRHLHPRRLHSQTFEALVNASLVCGQEFTLQALCNALHDIGKARIAGKITEMLSNKQ